MFFAAGVAVCCRAAGADAFSRTVVAAGVIPSDSAAGTLFLRRRRRFLGAVSGFSGDGEGFESSGGVDVFEGSGGVGVFEGFGAVEGFESSEDEELFEGFGAVGVSTIPDFSTVSTFGAFFSRYGGAGGVRIVAPVVAAFAALAVAAVAIPSIVSFFSVKEPFWSPVAGRTVGPPSRPASARPRPAPGPHTHGTSPSTGIVSPVSR